MADFHLQDSPSPPSHSDPSNSDREHRLRGGADLFSPYNSSSSDHSSSPNDLLSPGAGCPLGVQPSLFFDGNPFSSLMGSLGMAGDGSWSTGYTIGASGVCNAAGSPQNNGGNNIVVGGMDGIPEGFWLTADTPNPAPSGTTSVSAGAARSDIDDKGMNFSSLVVEEHCGPSSVPSPVLGASLQLAVASVDDHDVGARLETALPAFSPNPATQEGFDRSTVRMDVDMSSAFLHQGPSSTEAITFNPAWLSQTASSAGAPKLAPTVPLASAGPTAPLQTESSQPAASTSPPLLTIPGGFPPASPIGHSTPATRSSPVHTDAHDVPSPRPSRQLTEVEAAIPALCRPPRNGPRDNLGLILLGVALDGAKSRVETQVKITMVLVCQTTGVARLGDGAADGGVLKEAGVLVEEAGVKAGLERVGSWNYVKLPAFSAIKRKSKKLVRMGIPEEETLFLDVAVVRATEPREEIFCCTACQSRERKRIQRKRDARVRPAQEVDSDAEDGADGDEKRKIVLFNCGQYLDFETGEVTLPARITCYCRHHKEKKGFCIVITLRDAAGEVVAGGVTPPIMITDDHKAAAAAAKASRPPSDAEKGLDNPPGRKFAVKKRSELSAVGKVLRRGSADHSSIDRDHKSKRKAPYDASQRNSNRRISNHSSHLPSFAMTPLAMAKPSSSAPRSITPRTTLASPVLSPNPSDTLSPCSASLGRDRADSASESGGLGISSGTALTHADLRAPAASEAASSCPAAITAAHGDVPMRDEPVPSRSSHSSSPNVTRRSRLQASPPGSPGAGVDSFFSMAQSSATSMDAHFALPGVSAREEHAGQMFHASGSWDSLNVLSSSLATSPAWGAPAPAHNGQSQAIPKIGRLIPSEGPMQGGIDVTILGEGFFPGIVCVFGDTPAVPTHLWSTNTLVCTLPPSASPGPCVVSFRGIPITVSSGNSVQVFTYVDNSDQKLMELALQVVGLQMTGRIQDAKNVAMRIVGESASSNRHGSSGGSYQGGSQRGVGTTDSEDLSSMAASLAAAATSIMTSPSQSRPVSRANSGTNLRADAAAAAATEPLETHDFESIIIRFLTLLNFHPLDAVETQLPTSSISLQNTQGHTLLHLAVNLGFHKLVNYLLRNGIPVNARDKNGFTPLHFAALAGRVTITRLLLEAGAGTYYRNCAARTALDLARDRDQVDIVELLGRFQSRSMNHPRRYPRSFSEASSTIGSRRPSLAPSPVASASESGEASSGDADSIAGRTSDESDAVESGGKLSRSPSVASSANQPASDPAGLKPLDEADEVPDAHLLSEDESLSFGPDTRTQQEGSPLTNLRPIPLGASMFRKLALIGKLRLATPSISGITEIPAYTMYGLAALNPKTWRQGSSGPRSNGKTETLSEKSVLALKPGTKNASDWRSMYSQWWQMAPSKKATNQRRASVYPPSEDNHGDPSGSLALASASKDGASTPGKGITKAQVQAKLAHRLGYTPAVVDEGVIEAFAYHNSKYKSLKKDKMLYMFWIPVLFLALSYALYESFVFLQPRFLELLPGFSVGSRHSATRVY